MLYARQACSLLKAKTKVNIILCYLTSKDITFIHMYRLQKLIFITTFHLSRSIHSGEKAEYQEIPTVVVTPHVMLHAREACRVFKATMKVSGILYSLTSFIISSCENMFWHTNFLFVDASPSYEDIGDCTYRCHYCGAAFWYGERVQRASTISRPKYHLCCGYGKIIMEQPPDPPQYIRDLLSDATCNTPTR